MPCPPREWPTRNEGSCSHLSAVLDEPVRAFVVRPDKVCRNKGVHTTGGHDRLKGQGRAAVPGRRPPWSELTASRPASGRPALWGSGATAGRDSCAPTALGFGCRGSVIGCG